MALYSLTLHWANKKQRLGFLPFKILLFDVDFIHCNMDLDVPNMQI